MSGPYGDDELLPLSGIQHFAFCRRQWALIHIEQQWAENVNTALGHLVHERAHNPALSSDDDDRIVTRALPLVSHTLGLTGQADIVEFMPVQGDVIGVPLAGHVGLWQPRPVEYKRGRPKPDDCDEVQLCAQAMCLEEMLGAEVPEGHLYYAETRRRERVVLGENLRTRVMTLAADMHRLQASGTTPRAEHGRHCSQCSLVDACVPGLTLHPRSVHRYIQHKLIEMTDDSPPESTCD